MMEVSWFPLCFQYNTKIFGNQIFIEILLSEKLARMCSGGPGRSPGRRRPDDFLKPKKTQWVYF